LPIGSRACWAEGDDKRGMGLMLHHYITIL
jgi:hypothetical protein